MSINNSLNNTNTRTRIKNFNNKLLQNLDQTAVPKTYHVASKVDRIQEHRVDSTEPFTIAMVLVKFPVDYDVRCSLPNYRSHRPESCRFFYASTPGRPFLSIMFNNKPASVVFSYVAILIFNSLKWRTRLQSVNIISCISCTYTGSSPKTLKSPDVFIDRYAFTSR